VAVTEDDDRKRGALWLWGLLLLALLGLGAFLLLRNVGDDSDKAGVDVTDEEAPDAPAGGGNDTTDGDASTTTAPDGDATTTTAPGGATTTAPAGATTTAPPGATTTAPSGGATTAPAAGAGLSAGTVALVPPPPEGLGSVVGDQASGTGKVESVVADEGFWVGDGPGRRVFVRLTEEARGGARESPFQVTAGQDITLEGSVTALPDVSELGVTPEEGADELMALGGYIEATRVTLSN
jgi:hypothetical protein